MSDRIQASRRVQHERRARGWSQAELARRSGVTRQLVGAVESGRHDPGVSAALGLARALDTTVERLFAPRASAAVDVLGEVRPPGTAVVGALVGDTLVSVPRGYGADGSESWSLADGVWDGREVAWLPGGAPADLVLAGCDPVMGLLTGLVDRAGHRVLGTHASTGRSIAALAAGRVHGVLVHARPGELPEPPLPVRRWHVAQWQVGLAALGAGSVPPIEQIAERRPVVVQRDPGAGTQQAFARALRGTGADVDLPGPIGTGHVDVARRVLHGAGEAGVLMEPAALALGLAFAPLETHAVELWLAEEWVSLPAATALLEVLSSEALVRRARLLGGYDPSGCGSPVDGGTR
ncbi:substrate-binding domain-containing protein [Aeromicrobium sp. Leaf350]|uniref:substrate-binding domain-containing protein n=1 Tax=Aeromicrobium sp. Leaf350 TaxID=2876565 RepID=UPI001E452D30|nr:substrate-binding domain-containing protein [Aeromicrobium sp. Leaf350]